MRLGQGDDAVMLVAWQADGDDAAKPQTMYVWFCIACKIDLDSRVHRPMDIMHVNKPAR